MCCCEHGHGHHHGHHGHGHHHCYCHHHDHEWGHGHGHHHGHPHGHGHGRGWERGPGPCHGHEGRGGPRDEGFNWGESYPFGFRRHFHSPADEAELLERYLEGLEAEAAAVREHLAAIRAGRKEQKKPGPETAGA